MKKLALTIAILLSVVQLTHAQWTTSGTNAYFNLTGNVGIGNTSPTSLLSIGSSTTRGTLTVTGSTTQAPVIGLTDVRTSGHAYSLYSGLSAAGNFDIFDQNATAYRLTISPSGNIGIGTTTPSYPLDIANVSGGNINFRVTGGYSNFNSTIVRNTYGASGHLWDVSYGDVTTFSYYNGSAWSTNRLTFDNSGNLTAAGNLIVSGAGTSSILGNVGINTTNTQGYQFAVNGSVIAVSVNIKPYANWPDYVFKPTYQLPSLADVKTYIDKNRHLPEMPSAADIAKDGINVGQMNTLLTKKVEELTLYLIEKDKTEKGLQEQIDQLKKQMELLIKTKTN